MGQEETGAGEHSRMDLSRPIVVGSGYVGLVAALCFAEMGYRVLCVDSDAAKMAALQAGRATDP